MESVIKDASGLQVPGINHMVLPNNLETFTSDHSHPHCRDVKTLQTHQNIDQHAQTNERERADLLEREETQESCPVSSAEFIPTSNEAERMVATSAAAQAGEVLLENKAVASLSASIPKSSSADAVGEEELKSVETQKYKKGRVPNIGSSLVDFFTLAEIQEHLDSLKQNCDQNNARTCKNAVPGQCSKAETDKPCQLCGCTEVLFAPQAYCAKCGCRIKESWPFWTLMGDGTNLYVCKSCFNACKGNVIELEGEAYQLSSLTEGESLEDLEEPWVRCDKCNKWQHEVCALFNVRLNIKGQADYTCPICWLKIREENSLCPTSSAVKGAKDLPRTVLSDYIENHLEKRLEYEKCERAQAQGKDLDEVLVANPLIVRVVSCADKKLEVKDKFLKTFHEDGYPKEFSYKSKMLLLFQNIEAVDVCLFAMYVHEFGARCPLPNQRHIYLAYVDSVNYFRPQLKTATGESLRTFVYHELIIGYLDFCKKKGFTRCNIWVSPPSEGENYIFNCHPQSQKTPKSNQLQNWYSKMLDTAASKNIVTEKVYLYDHFFVKTKESKANITAARLPYFDEDYISIKAEEIIGELEIEKTQGVPNNKERARIATATKRAKDFELMRRLGNLVRHQKNYILVHLQHICRHCCEFISSGSCWTCQDCEYFIICNRCYNVQVNLDISKRHPVNKTKKHQLNLFTTSILGDTVEGDDKVKKNEFFDTRETFLSICQSNHYQFDTLRKAKYSSMMLLHHLHDPAASTLPVMREEITQEGVHDDRPSIMGSEPPCEKVQEKRQISKAFLVIDLLKHTFQCTTLDCEFGDDCQQLKKLFRHERGCENKAQGTCEKCKKIWSLLQVHARVCKDEECNVFHCSEYKIKLKRRAELRHQADITERVRSQEDENEAK